MSIHHVHKQNKIIALMRVGILKRMNFIQKLEVIKSTCAFFCFLSLIKAYVLTAETYETFFWIIGISGMLTRTRQKSS